jgi:hypothetical protein
MVMKTSPEHRDYGARLFPCLWNFPSHATLFGTILTSALQFFGGRKNCQKRYQEEIHKTDANLGYVGLLIVSMGWKTGSKN